MDEVFLFIQILDRSVCAYACTVYTVEWWRTPLTDEAKGYNYYYSVKITKKICYFLLYPHILYWQLFCNYLRRHSSSTQTISIFQGQLVATEFSLSPIVHVIKTWKFRKPICNKLSSNNNSNNNRLLFATTPLYELDTRQGDTIYNQEINCVFCKCKNTHKILTDRFFFSSF